MECSHDNEDLEAVLETRATEEVQLLNTTSAQEVINAPFDAPPMYHEAIMASAPTTNTRNTNALRVSSRGAVERDWIK